MNMVKICDILEQKYCETYRLYTEYKLITLEQ